VTPAANVPAAVTPVPAWRSRRWAITAALAVTQTVSWGVLYYAFTVFLLPMRRALGASETELTGALTTGILVSAVAGVLVGRYLDRHSPRVLMTGASAVGALGVAAWSQAGGLLELYSAFVLLGLVMACVLYEPAFVVLAKHFPAADERRRAITAVTLVAALASFIFVPLAQALVSAGGWRQGLLILAGILAAVTIPLHALALRPAPATPPAAAAPHGGTKARAALRDPSFWVLTAAFGLASVAGFGAIVLAVPALVDRDYAPAFAAFAAGLIGISQIPGRLLLALIGGRLRPAARITFVFGLMATGLALFAAAGHRDFGVVAGLVVVGMANGMAILARATALADRYGSAAYGAIAGTAAVSSTAARAVAPVAAAAIAATTSYVTLMWTLAGLALMAAALTGVDRRWASATNDAPL
jgi:predicted MFS family arabinose efflux permease